MPDSFTTSFYSRDELDALGFQACGTNVLVSRKVSIYNAQAISLGNNVRIDDFALLSARAPLRIGSYVHISAFCGLYARAGLVIDDFVTVSGRVSIYTESDDFLGASLTNPMVDDSYKPGYIRGEIRLGRHAIVGASSTILPGVTLAEGAAVGAHSLVKCDCEPWTVYGGVPAKRLRERSRDALELERKLLRAAP